MIKILCILTTLILFVSFIEIPKKENSSDECDISQFFEGIDADNGVKVITDSGDFVDAEIILVPAELKIGKFSVEVTRKESNLYKIEGTTTYFETRGCYEYATRDDAFLIIESSYGYKKGKIIFED